MNVKIHCSTGGTNYREDQKVLKEGVHIVVGTPGRVLDMLTRKTLNPDHMKIFVLDEADEMLGRGFLETIKDIFGLLPPEIQVGLFSATMPLEIL